MVLDGASQAAYKELHRVIKFVLDTKNLGLKFEPTLFKSNEPWNLVGYSDSDYASDPDTRRSISGFVLYVCGVPISWRSKSQRTVTLSSSKAEWIAASEAVKEIMLVYQLVESIGIKVSLPIVIRVDNVGAIFMSKNITTTGPTKHVDIRFKYVNEYVDEGIVKIIFVRSNKNDSDIFTKNLGGDLYEKHSSKMVKWADEN